MIQMRKNNQHNKFPFLYKKWQAFCNGKSRYINSQKKIKKKKQHNKPRKKMGCGNTKNQRWANNFEEFKSMKQRNRTKQHSIDAQQI